LVPADRRISFVYRTENQKFVD